MAEEKGFSRRLPLGRRLINDFLYASQSIPLIPMERVMELKPLVLAREEAFPRPGWCAIFLRAYALLSQRRPELRDIYLKRPWERLYRHPYSVACVAIEREWQGELLVLPAIIRRPETSNVYAIEAYLERCKTVPVPEIGSFRRTLVEGSLPWPLRRLFWSLGLNWFGDKRAKRLGTFGISVTAGMGASQLAIIVPWTTGLHYGRFDRDGSIAVRLTFDHRVMDGAVIARAMAELETILLGQVLDEVTEGSLRHQPAQASPSHDPLHTMPR